MKYPVRISRRIIENDWLLMVPDLPGCQVIGQSIDVVYDGVNNVIADHLAILAEYGEAIPHASLLDKMIAENTETNITWAIVDFDIVPYLGKSHKINVTLPELLIKQIDDKVNKSEQYKTRSGFIALACVMQLTK